MKQCKLCKSYDLNRLRKIKSNHNNLFYTLFKCVGCRSYFFDFNENRVKLDALYDDIAEDLTLPKEFKPNRYWYDQVNRIQKLQPKIHSVLDVGCRSGDFLLHWSEEVEKVGVELSSKAAQVALERGINIHNKFIEKIDFADKKFDFITCYAILEHIENPLPVMDRLTSLVKKNGGAAIMIPSIENIKAQLLYVLRYRWHMFSPPEHLNFYSRQFLDEYMRSKGFELADRIYTSGGMFNPFGKVPVFNRVFGKMMFIADHYTPLNKIPIFDHMYSYYLKK
jgi:ubiquinone/menaquinone biosynthesis C-methylase UbiE